MVIDSSNWRRVLAIVAVGQVVWLFGAVLAIVLPNNYYGLLLLFTSYGYLLLLPKAERREIKADNS